jgi:hypothetical protein
VKRGREPVSAADTSHLNSAIQARARYPERPRGARGSRTHGGSDRIRRVSARSSKPRARDADQEEMWPRASMPWLTPISIPAAASRTGSRCASSTWREGRSASDRRDDRRAMSDNTAIPFGVQVKAVFQHWSGSGWVCRVL